MQYQSMTRSMKERDHGNSKCVPRGDRVGEYIQNVFTHRASKPVALKNPGTWGFPNNPHTAKRNIEKRYYLQISPSYMCTNSTS